MGDEIKISEILKGKPSKLVTVRGDQTVGEALGVMTQHGIGSALVVDEQGALAGIFTERDLLYRLHRSGAGILKAPVESQMTKDLVIATPQDSAEYLLGVMTQQRIRHVPIFENKKLVGLLSIGDLVKAQLKNAEVKLQLMQDYIEAKYPG